MTSFSDKAKICDYIYVLANSLPSEYMYYKQHTDWLCLGRGYGGVFVEGATCICVMGPVKNASSCLGFGGVV